ARLSPHGDGRDFAPLLLFVADGSLSDWFATSRRGWIQSSCPLAAESDSPGCQGSRATAGVGEW
ncbi:MAG TPA: hypothetical protein QF626_05860, partial [Prochlorococcaceae cyanobacterium Fu_MAG_50]|nr:hypothetical protein [Prochlorococcaceae cyanobacterium Fu_MAG_50]